MYRIDSRATRGPCETEQRTARSRANCSVCKERRASVEHSFVAKVTLLTETKFPLGFTLRRKSWSTTAMRVG